MKAKRILAFVIAIVLTFSLFTTAFARYKGDVTNDGEVNSSDALAVLRYAVGLEVASEIEPDVADMTGDGVINSSDALSILRVVVGMDEKVEIPEEPDVPEIPEEPSAPATGEEIVALYNDAVNKVVSEKAGYKKERITNIIEMNGGALMSMAEGVVKDFLGEGSKTYTNNKGVAKYLLTSTLAASDVTSALCEDTGDSYTITLNLKNGTSSATKTAVSDTSPLAKCGLLTGNVADPDYDYLSSGSIYASVTAENVKVDKIVAKNTNAKIVAVVEKESGKLVSLRVSYDWTIEMTKVKYSIITVNNADGKAQTEVEFKNFSW